MLTAVDRITEIAQALSDNGRRKLLRAAERALKADGGPGRPVVKDDRGSFVVAFSTAEKAYVEKAIGPWTSEGVRALALGAPAVRPDNLPAFSRQKRRRIGLRMNQAERDGLDPLPGESLRGAFRRRALWGAAALLRAPDVP